MTAFKQFFRFGVSGVSATLIHILVASFAFEIAGVGSIIGNLSAYTVATGFSYVTNTRWSFTSTHTPARFRRFMAVSLAGAALTAIIAALAERSGASPYLGLAVVVLCVPPVSFAGHKYWTYRT